jgi:hypothetical protein
LLPSAFKIPDADGLLIPAPPPAPTVTVYA